VIPIEEEGFIATGGFEYYSNSTCTRSELETYIAVRPNSQPDNNSSTHPYSAITLSGAGDGVQTQGLALYPFGKPQSAAALGIRSVHYLTSGGGNSTGTCEAAFPSAKEMFAIEGHTAFGAPTCIFPCSYSDGFLPFSLK